MPGVPNNPAPLVRKLVSAGCPQRAKDEIRGETTDGYAQLYSVLLTTESISRV